LAPELVGWLDEDGYLRVDDADNLRFDWRRWRDVERDIGRLSRASAPPVCLPRSLDDCMALQLAAQDNLTPVHQALLDNLALLGQGDIWPVWRRRRALRRLICPPYLQAIRSLDPRPAAAFCERHGKHLPRPILSCLRAMAAGRLI
jgi:DNA-directed RNA polymerase specialized sigma54-like protein